MSKIKSLREKFNMTQQDVSNESGVNIDTILYLMMRLKLEVVEILI